MISLNDTIAAIATPVGSGGIGIIKISGLVSLKISQKIFKSKGISNNKFKSHHMYLGYIIEPESKKIIDEVLYVFMKAPNSYTGEDVVEIHTHGSRLVLNTILELLLNDNHIRLAQAGEFTKRAFLNGKIDLTKAEALQDLISSKTYKSLLMASSQLNGSLNDEIEKIRLNITNALSQIEASIDFFEECEEISYDNICLILDEVTDLICKLLNKYKEGKIFKEGIKIVITGQPNVGKSSLMNCLANKQRSIVTSIPGTTRDVIEDYIEIDGIPFFIADTAGLHKTDNSLENIGIDLAKQYISQADLVIFVIDASKTITEKDFHIYNEISSKKIIVALNKIDLVKQDQIAYIPENWNIDSCKISAKYETGIDILKKQIIDIIGISEGDPFLHENYAPNLRHKNILENVLELINSAKNGLISNIEPDLIAIDLRLGLDKIGEIAGFTYTDDILDRIFSQFCIGK